jgi:hypothetical protein
VRKGRGVIDTADVTKPSLRRFDLPGSSCMDLAVDDTSVYCATADDGVRVMPLE